jgi:hypothetical protein
MVRLEAQVMSQQQTIDVLQNQLAIAQGNHEMLLHRVINPGAAPAPGPQFTGGPQFQGPRRHTVDFAPPPPSAAMPGVFEGPGLPMPTQAPKGGSAPTPADLADTYVGSGSGAALFEDMGDEEAGRQGIAHDEITGTVQRGKRQPSH